MKKEWQFRLWGRVFILPAWVKWLLLAAAILTTAAVGFFMQKARETEGNIVLSSPAHAASETSVQTSSENLTPSPSVWVYVVGAVKRPGVYQLSAGALVTEAITAAGGFSEDADPTAINLVSVLRENTMIKVPVQGDDMADCLTTDSTSDNGPAAAGKININTASVEELCTLPGIGESTAKKIIRYREDNGPFEKTEDLMNVPGIKEAKFASVKEDICVG